MDYFKILNLKREPFSNSPDPAFFFQSRQHQGCLQKLELSLRMRRGLNVVIGDVGTGKTTLCRQLIRNFSGDDDVETHLVLDPDFGSVSEFLSAVAEIFEGETPSGGEDDWQIKERIKKIIYRRGVDQNRVTVLIIDEGQKIPEFCLEVLREFLNYETNENKLLQIVIFAQTEFDATLAAHSNFADRVNLYHRLEPLDFRDTRMMIRFRVKKSSDLPKGRSIFTYPALWAIYRATGGYPRKIINLCHQSVLAMIIQNRSRAGWFLVRSCVRRALARPPVRRHRWAGAVGIGVLIFAGIAGAGIYLQKSRLQVRQDPPAVREMADVSHVRVSKQAESTMSAVENGPETVAEAIPTVPSGNEGRPAVGLEAEDQSEAQTTLPKALETGVSTPVRVAEVERSVEKAVERPIPPGVLGHVALKRRETLSWMCIKTYGVYNRQVLRTLDAINPGMGNPDNLGVGESIVFPARPVPVSVTDRVAWWIKIAESPTLKEAFDIIRTYRVKGAPIRIIPHWNPEEGIRFTVILWRYYFDRVSAEHRRNRLPPPPIDVAGGVFSQWPEETVFFSDPFLGRGG